MLDAFIIEELRRREQEQQKGSQENRLQLPVPDDRLPRRPTSRPQDSWEMPREHEHEHDDSVIVVDVAAACQLGPYLPEVPSR